MHGRGANSNPSGRFERLQVEPDPEFQGFSDEEGASRRSTVFYKDGSRSALTSNQSPDVPFNFSLNPYRGCEHGCSYCYARPTHEYLGYSAGLDFETQIVVKDEAPELLRAELARPGWKPEPLSMSGVTDPYQPVERRLQLTRRCLEVLADFGQPVQMITKNHLITRDLDLLRRLAERQAVTVALSVTSLDRELARRLEPRASEPGRRLAAIEALSRAGIPVSIMVAPVIPGLNDHELPRILQAGADAGARAGGYILLRLPGAVAPLFTAWLEEHYPLQKEKILRRIRGLRGGALNVSTFHERFRGQGPAADQLSQLFEIGLRKAGLELRLPAPNARFFAVPGPRQLGLFE